MTESFGEKPFDGLPPLRDVIAEYGLNARKSLGQNFLLDLNLTGRIARAAGDLTQGTVIEVGPGPGGLTRALLGAGAQRVIAIERDTRCQGIHAQIAAAYPGRLEIIEADALKIDAATLGDAPRKIVANLPYNVATPLLLGWLKTPQAFDCLVLMFQKEVVDRLAAKPGTKHYGRLSVIAQWLAEVRPQFEVNPRAFTPPPKVTSTVVRLDPRPEPLAPARMETLEKVTAAAFGQRRKMLRASLKSLGDAEALCAAAGLDPTARAETISVEGFAALARAVDGAR
ncbi:16S rRNA (adenine(1518)-N(6)/adenine(1519)-N(6))-dimethyltransferase RsmA [Rhodospirillum sp. A1_3_36]|uniref:16S rRNA (adenine(1518)-N(6)/adenine(1519)-N(6))- dimethyltransferase RsmA n=1 Tax=Rhodospirillum sp. A1_3_36 TaxID=3391666 RepID=UPI0039A42D5F